jgi:hypothetical protein
VRRPELLKMAFEGKIALCKFSIVMSSAFRSLDICNEGSFATQTVK